MKFIWVIPLIVAIDQISKFVVQASMHLRQSEPVLGDFFRLTYIHNPGAAFGLNMGSPILHTIISIAALGVLGYLYRTLKPDERLLRYALCLVLGGAIGNIIDRLYLGAVVDFFDFGIAEMRWPIFNFADSFVTVGVALLALGYSRRSEETREKEETLTSSPEERIARG